MSGSRHPNSSSSTASKQQLSSWGLPQPILEAFSKKGLKQLYPWQTAALECAAAGNNLVYCAPTSGGKSLVADVLMLARLHKTQQALLAKLGPSSRRKPQQKPVTRALIVLPYLSIVSEKTAHLSKLLECVKWRVMGYQGDDADGQPLVHQAERVSICSIEKANGAINRMIQEQRLHELVSVTIDEAHMLADPNRGAALEMLLAKLMASRAQSAIQIVAMSATMSGLDSLSAWLDAHLFLTNFRPVPLTEHAVFQGTVYAKAERQQLLKLEGGDGAESDCILQEQRVVAGGGKTDKDSFLTLVAEVVAERHSVLVFCAGRAACQSCAAMLADQLLKRLGPPDPAAAAARADLIEQLRIALSGSSDPAFEKLLAAGVAFHHAGLTHQERSVVEQGFSSGALLVLTATSTLAAGVNLPARRVILRSLWQGVGDVTRAQYLQMVGRAGRAGHSAVGESYLVAQGAPHSTSGQWTKVCQLLAAPLPVLHSQLVQQSPPTGQAITKAGPKQLQQQQQQQLSALPPNGHGAASGGCSSCPPSATATGASGHRSELTQGASSGGASGYTITSQTGPAGSHDLPNGSLYTTASGAAAAQAVAAAVASRGPASQPHLQQHVSQQQHGRGAGTSSVSTAAQPNMQHLLLDAVATGLVSTGQTILQLLQNTLAYFHLPFDVLADAAKAALSALRARKLISFKPDGPDGPSHWELTALGNAVVASALAPDVGLLLHGRLANMLACMVLGSNLHLLYVLQPDPLLTIYDWSCWHRLMNELSPPQQRVADVEGLEQLYIDRRMAGLRGDAISDAQHGRFAAAVLLDRLVADISSMHALEQAWGKPSTLTKGGISRGIMQRWQMEVSKTAAMAALLAANAGWWQLETLLAPLAAQVAAGVRPELLALMKVPGMQPSHAAALHAAGFGHPDLLLCASESEVAAALAAGLPANMRKRKALDKKGLSVGLTGNASTNAMVARAARSVLAAARQYAVMAAAAAEAAGEEDEEQQASLQSQQQQQVPPLITLRTKMLVGQATVHQVWPTSNDPLLPRLLDTWQLQSSFSLAVLLSEQRCAATVAASAGNPAAAGGGGGWLCSGSTEHRQQAAAGPSSSAGCAVLHGGVATALVLCWADREAVLLHLPGSRSSPKGSSNRGGGSGGCSRPGGGCSTLGRGAATACTTQHHQPTAAGGAGSTAAAAVQGGVNTDVAGWVWSVIDHVFGDANKTVTCIGASQVLAALAAAGIHCNTAVDDPCSAFMLWQPRGLDSAAAAAAAASAAAVATNQQQEQQQQKPPVAASAEEASKAAAAVVLGGAFRLQVPLLPGSNAAAATAATAAAKAALLGRALMPPLRAMLARQQLTAAYERVEQPLQQVIAEVRGTGLRVQCRHIQQQLQLCVWQLQVLQQQISQYVGHQQLQQQQQQQLDNDSGRTCGVDDSSIRLLLRQQRLLTVSNDRLQQQPLLQLVLLALKAAFKRKHTAALPLLRLLLTYCQVQQYEQQLQQLLQYSVLPGYERQPGRGAPSFAGDSYNNSYNGFEPSAMPHQGYIILQPMASEEPVTGQLLPGWPAGLEDLTGFRPVPGLPVLTSTASLAQQGVIALSSPVSVAAALQPSLQQQQQQQQQYVVGRLCAVGSSSGSAEASLCTSQQLPWQMPEDSTALPVLSGTAAAAGGVRGQQRQQQCSADWAACGRLGSIRVWCGVTESVRELQLPTTALYRVYSHHNQQQQQQQSSWHALQQQQQQQQHCDAGAVPWGAATHPVTAQHHSGSPAGPGSNGGSNGSNGSLAFLPSCCSLTHLLQSISPTHTFIGVQLQCLPLLVLAGLSQDKTLISACCQNPDPLAAAAAAWCPFSGLPEPLQAALLGNIQAGVLDGVPVAAEDAPRLLFAAALQGLVCGHKPSVQREQLGVEWPAGTNLVESLMRAFPGVAAWRRQLLEDVQNTRFLKTCSGRKIPFKIPAAGQNPSKALIKQIKEAEGSSVSLMLLSCMGDVERLVAAAVYRACGDLQDSLRSSSGGGGTTDGRDRGSGALGAGSLAAPGDDDRPDRPQAARVSAAAGRTQMLAGAAAGRLDVGAGQGHRNGSAAACGPAVSTAAGAACGAGPAAMAAGVGGPRAPAVTTCDAPGRLLPADAAGAPSGFSFRGAEEGSAEQQRVRCVAVGGQQVVVEVPSEWALPLLQSCSRQVGQEVSDLLGLAAEGPELPVYPAAAAAAGGGGGGGSLGTAAAAAPEAPQLPFRWWWGSSLDLLQANFFGV